MGATFRPGDVARHVGRDVELVVEGYDQMGRVICWYWLGAMLTKAAFREAELEKVVTPRW
jgi:uncharacterized protein YodC (DUF2158 family)